jgi:tRNA-specific 2-thiouridylase
MPDDMRRKIAVAMSGGVDSSVAALLLKEQGWDVTGLHMRSGLPRAGSDPAQEARRAAEAVGVPLQVVDLSDDFARLVSHFVEEYGRGRTPNPCVVCNRDLKFGRLLECAERLGADRLATGHYARVQAIDGEPALLRAADPAKDQSYALFAIRYARLGRVMLPLGGMTKADVRRLAAARRLPARDREESQEICFVEGDYMDLIRARRPEVLRSGPIVDECGCEVGRHEGVAAFTIGQRRGVGIAFGRPRYVTRIDARTATVHVGPAEDLLAGGLRVEGVNWLLPEPPDEPFESDVKIRYRHAAAAATIRPEAGRAVVRFRAPQRAVTPGQAAVFYRGDRVLGSGWIAAARNAKEPPP